MIMGLSSCSAASAGRSSRPPRSRAFGTKLVPAENVTAVPPVCSRADQPLSLSRIVATRGRQRRAPRCSGRAAGQCWQRLTAGLSGLNGQCWQRLPGMKKKVLLMGRSGSGKTSMRSIIFANYIARDTMRLGATIDVEHSHVRFLGNLMLNLWDCGGQENFMASYFESQKGHIFAQVHVLIYVFDIESTRAAGSADAPDSRDTEYFVSCLKALQEHSKNVKVFCLIHKMDVVEGAAEQERVFKEQQAQLQELAAPYVSSIDCFPTSIWDASLYKAWSSMVHSLIPNVATLESQLSSFCQICQADEVVLFERATFLVICHKTANEQSNADAHRFEKISNIVKQFKLSCAKSQAQFEKMEVQNSRFTAFIDVFTSNTYLMVVLSPQSAPGPGGGGGVVEPAVPLLNIALARQHFESVVAPSNDA